MKADAPLPLADVNLRLERRLKAIHLQEIEGNPLTAEEVEMFEMFDRKGWSGNQRRAYIISQIKRPNRR